MVEALSGTLAAQRIAQGKFAHIVSYEPRAERRRRYSAAMMMTVITTSMVVETAAKVGFTCSSMSFHICRGRVLTSPPLTNSAIVSSSNEVMKANRN
jgi:hypothetical protein